MFEVSVEASFAAAHSLRDYPGKCARLHGHNYKVEVTMEGRELDPAGLLIDFVEVKRGLKAVLERIDHGYLNELPPFDAWNPSAENIARYVYQELAAQLESERVKLARVKVWETESSSATYRP